MTARGPDVPEVGAAACKGLCDSGSREVQEMCSLFQFQLLGSFTQEFRVSGLNFSSL